MSHLTSIADPVIGPEPTDSLQLLEDFDAAQTGRLSWMQFVEPKAPAIPAKWDRFDVDHLQVAGLELCGLVVYAKWNDGYAGDRTGYEVQKVEWRGIDITNAIDDTLDAMDALNEQIGEA